jgi:hypothetical protein
MTAVSDDEALTPEAATSEDNSVKTLLAYCRDKSRVCPTPQPWNSLWKLLPNHSGVGTGWEPAMPLILGAWLESTNSEKRLRLTAHIEWAKEWGALEAVKSFLYSLDENQWFHLGD